ncbi:reverse transcriptase [Phytophthora megakarya]|uniref:Reverse transcriptase n=1 Tax=Phytophthora megakarya TaxID=4795 RepID=A0A225VUH5_9STRA|nr:reverse transcriptase [Phytophthora megakarya]
MITSCSEKKIRVYTRYSVLAWLFKSKTVDGRCLKWAVNLSPSDLDIRRVENDQDGLAAILGAGITPRERLDEVAEILVPDKGYRIKTSPVSLEMLSSDHIGHLLSFDGAAKRDGSGGAACILWSLPSWEIVAATGHFLEKATVNEAEYSGLVKGMQLALNAGIQELVVVGDSRLLQEAEGLQAKFKSLRLVHVKRDFNAAADYISKRTTHLAKIADQFVLDSWDALFYVSRNTPERPRDAADRLRLVVPQDLQEDILSRRPPRLTRECVDCATAKGLHRNPGSSPGNLLATPPFQVVSMDFVIPLHQSARGNTALLLFQCAFSGFIMCKAMASTEAQDVAEAYEECVFRRFGASEMIRHDRDPQFMGRVFKHFREMLGSRQRATLAYRPQANGQQERSVQTVIRSVKAHVQTVDQSPVEAMMGDFPREVQLRDAQEWRTKIQCQVEYARAWARDLQAKAKSRRVEDHNQKWKHLTDRLKEGFEVGDSVWLYLARVRPGLTKKLAHLWHGPFRILEKGSDYRYRLQVEGTEYRFYPWVHVSRLKPRAKYPERPLEAMNIPEDDGFDAALLREDSWEPDEGSGEYEVEAILDGRLNCGRLLYEFDQGERARVRFQAMQSGDELPDEEVR